MKRNQHRDKTISKVLERAGHLKINSNKYKSPEKPTSYNNPPKHKLYKKL